jgi:hypothetical protein
MVAETDEYMKPLAIALNGLEGEFSGGGVGAIYQCTM